ncbi:MAG: YaiI/YqxD family protein [Deltaproteobacteria bacterium]|nr:YaiI/YqxD family protein [Deltaproteobacteria bacterium]
MRIWIDADACPREVKEVIFRASGRTGASVVLVANKALFFPKNVTPAGSALITMVQVNGGADVADDHIVDHAAAGDIVITADIPLAARLVPKQVVVIDVRGELFDAENIGERLSVRDFMADVRDSGVVTGGPRAWTPRDKQRFASALDAALHRSKVRR